MKTVTLVCGQSPVRDVVIPPGLEIPDFVQMGTRYFARRPCTARYYDEVAVQRELPPDRKGLITIYCLPAEQ